MYQTPPLPELTCWEKKAGVDLFPDVPSETLTVHGAKGTDDELLKLAIEESLKLQQPEKLSLDLTKANCSDPLCLNPK